jgi:hypothetical protein
MAYLNAFEVLTSNFETITDEETFTKLVLSFRVSYLQDKSYRERLLLHRNPVSFQNSFLEELNLYLLQIQNRDEMRDADEVKKIYSYVPSVVTDIFNSNKKIKTCFQAIVTYCEVRSKEIRIVAVHMAEYKAINRIFRNVNLSVKKAVDKQTRVMKQKNFDLERRESHGKPYLKISLRPESDFEALAKYLENLSSVKNVNVTKQSSGRTDLTAYPERISNIEELESEISHALSDYFSEKASNRTLLNEIKAKPTREHSNISILANRMEQSFEQNDFAGVLHASASIFETMAKDIINSPTIQNQSLGGFFSKYRNESNLPKEILDYIFDIYSRRNTTPLAGHGSTSTPHINREEALVLKEMTIAFVRIEYGSKI